MVSTLYLCVEEAVLHLLELQAVVLLLLLKLLLLLLLLALQAQIRVGARVGGGQLLHLVQQHDVYCTP